MMSTEQKYCCDSFKLSVSEGIIRQSYDKWISDIVMYRENKSMLSDIYKIQGITFIVYHFCPWCGASTDKKPNNI